MKHRIILLYAWLIELYRKPIMLTNTTIKFIFIPGFNRLRTFNGKARAYAEFVKAKKNVPAYRKFLQATEFSRPSFNGIVPNIHEIPFMDKESYINKYSIEDRCVNGEIDESGVIIDESSGSSGTATNWVRGQKERKRNARMIQFGMKNLLGEEPLFIINAFAMGAWATGLNISMSCVAFSKIKSLGPDKTKIENTIQQFGKSHQYIIMGYPPFLKLLIDTANINWKEYNVSLIFGGESMSESMRDYLIEKGIKKIYSSYGASDLELNISAENDFTIDLRRLLRSNDQLRESIVRYPGALPMLFQFNPADFLIESSAEGELIITICRPDYLSPKIRYNIHDRGHVLHMKELYIILKKLNIDNKKLIKPTTDLPILLHYGRADMTVSFFGANISPIDIQEVLYNLSDLAQIVNSFYVTTDDDYNGNKQLIISLEIQHNKSSSEINLVKLQIDFFETLAKINQDFRESKKMVSDNNTIVRIYEFGHGPFTNNDIRIKSKYT